MEIAVIICIITLSVLVVSILVLLGILFYNQMLVTNEVNKRLLLIAKDSIDQERSTQAELQDALIELDRAANENQSPKEESVDEEVTPDEPFNPHEFSETNLND